MRRRLFVSMFVASLPLAAGSQASLIYDVPNGITTKPADDRGWSVTGSWQVGGGVAVAPNYFLTAQHLGGAPGQSFAIDGHSYTTASFTDIGGTDLRLVKINGTFSGYAPLYRGAAGSEAGQAISMIGFGRYAHGSAVTTGTTQNGWAWGAAAGKNFAMNTAAGVVALSGMQLLDYTFNPVSGQNEGIYSVGDSGGGTFINTGGAWRLAGVNFAITNVYSQPLAPSPLQASIFNGTGLYVKDQNGDFVAATSPQAGYSVDIASYISKIDAVLLPGDVNDDGLVNFNDLLTLAQNYGKAGTWKQGDVNQDGSVNFNDLLALAQHYGQSLPGGAVTSTTAAIFPADAALPGQVPEPGAGAALAALLLLRRGRRRCR